MYVNWLSSHTGARRRLLSEAEWEYAARAGTTGPCHFGDRISTDQANFSSAWGGGDDCRGGDDLSLRVLRGGSIGVDLVEMSVVDVDYRRRARNRVAGQPVRAGP